jgi:hypothetical protein
MKKYKNFVTEAGRCWPGHKPVPGKEPFSPGSCVKEEVIEEGRPSQRHPLEGHDYHKKTNAQLEYIAKDAHKAAEAMKSHNTTAENKYRDQANDSATVRYWRQKNGMPDWYKKKYGHIKEEVEQIDELSKDTLTSYAIKAGKSLGGQVANIGNAKQISKFHADKTSAKEVKKDAIHTAGKRMFGLGRAASRLAKEETVTEASYINGVKQDPASKVWKLTSMSHADAVAKHGKENVRHVDAINRSGDKTGKKHVEILSKLGEQVEPPVKKPEDVNAGKFTSGAAKPAFKNPSLVSPQNESAAWQRKEGKNPEGGLNRKGIASYRAENPGSKLSMAVTTPPSKLKPGSKAANRRKSFCARMGGMPGPMKKPNGEPTRKALSLKKWNC